MDAYATLAPQLLCAPSSFAQPAARSPVFDFDTEWAEHVTALRTTTKIDTMGSSQPSPTDAESFMMELQYDGASPPQADAQWATTTTATDIPQVWDGTFWAEEQWSGVRQYYGAYSTCE